MLHISKIVPWTEFEIRDSAEADPQSVTIPEGGGGGGGGGVGHLGRGRIRSLSKFKNAPKELISGQKVPLL